MYENIYTMRGLIRVLLDYPMDMKIDEDAARDILTVLETERSRQNAA